MAFLLKFSIVFCTFLFYSASYCTPVRNTADLRIPAPFSLVAFCSDYLRYSFDKIPCLICKGIDPTCFVKRTTTTTTSTTTTSATPTSTTTQTTAAPTTTTPFTTSSTTTTIAPVE